MTSVMRKVVWMTSVVFALTSLMTLAGCTAGVDEELTESTANELTSGVNGSGCKRSAYNCSLHSGGEGQRVRRADGGQTWAVDDEWLVAQGFVDPQTKAAVVPVVDGNGDEMGRVKKESFTLNYGQTRRMKDLTYVFALSTGLQSAGWVPIDAFRAATSLRERVGEVNARGGNLKAMECYEVKSTYPERLDDFKVVKGATDKDAMEPDDYLPVKRANGKVYVNLAFNVPGDAIGGPAVDIFPAGTKFQRLSVPTWEKPARPSLDATLYAKPAGASAYTKPDGAMKFVYGYVTSNAGAVRYGWMAYDGLAPSTGCANR
jgi:hypothetical protein